MKASEIDRDIKLLDLENFFNVYEDGKGLYNYNLNSTVYFDGVPQETYSLDHDMYWTTLSYVLYKSTRAWWLLMKLNGVDRDRIFDIVKAGSQVKYVSVSVLNSIIEAMMKQQ